MYASRLPSAAAAAATTTTTSAAGAAAAAALQSRRARLSIVTRRNANRTNAIALKIYSVILIISKRRWIKRLQGNQMTWLNHVLQGIGDVFVEDHDYQADAECGANHDVKTVRGAPPPRWKLEWLEARPLYAKKNCDVKRIATLHTRELEKYEPRP
jgi:3-oxoacyl-ACP reductase-like protein